MHLVVDVANRQVLACTGGAGARVTGVPFDAVHEELTWSLPGVLEAHHEGGERLTPSLSRRSASLPIA